MATISSLTNGGTLQDNDKIPIARVSGGAYVNNAILGADLKSIVPAGVILYFALQAAPSGWIECNGAVLSTAAGSMYTTLRTLLINDGNRFGVVGSDPKVPDLRGKFIRGNGSDGTHTSGAFGITQNYATNIKNWSVSVVPNNAANGGVFRNFFVSTTRTVDQATSGTSDAVGSLEAYTNAQANAGNGSYRDGTASSICRASLNVSFTNETETRPANIPLLACIKL